MFSKISFYIAFVIFSLGAAYKVSTWFRYCLEAKTEKTRPAKRVYAFLKGITLVLFSAKIITLIRVFVLDVLFQARTFRASLLRWVMHMCLFGGFMGLLFMHALDRFITSPLFADYYPTLNPFLFLRNLFTAFVIAGLILAAYRRFFSKEVRLFTNAMDYITMILLAGIMASGILLEASKMSSHMRYQDMVVEHSDLEEQELVALENYWVKTFGVASPNVKGPFDEKTLELGYEVHEMNCAECHSRPQWAFLSYGTSKITKPVTVKLDGQGLSTLLWYIHVLSCFIGLAYLPFSKMFHIFVSPLSLLANAVMDSKTSDPANMVTKQMMELDACMHCGACSLSCSVAVCYEEIPNVNILPSEKIAAVKKLAAGKNISEQELKVIQGGLVLCTNCYRCTAACPVGIKLQDLWFNVREALFEKGLPEFFMLSPLSLYRGNKREEMDTANYHKPLEQVKQAIAREYNLADSRVSIIENGYMRNGHKRQLTVSVQGKTSTSCYSCKTCTMACPVVRNFEKPREALGLMPHQIIHAANLGLMDLAFSSNMLWRCLGCYECQEQCPQGVEVTDVFYELKNLAVSCLNEKVAENK